MISSITIEYLFDSTNGTTLDQAFVLGSVAFKTLATGRVDSIERLAESGIQVTVSDSATSYGFFVTEDRLALTAYDDVNRLQALVDTENSSALEWGRRMFEAHRRQSVSPEEYDGFD